MKIVQGVLLHKCQVDGHSDMIANHLIREYNFMMNGKIVKMRNCIIFF